MASKKARRCLLIMSMAKVAMRELVEAEGVVGAGERCLRTPACRLIVGGPMDEPAPERVS
jgi:hypothetical protein